MWADGYGDLRGAKPIAYAHYETTGRGDFGSQPDPNVSRYATVFLTDRTVVMRRCEPDGTYNDRVEIPHRQIYMIGSLQYVPQSLAIAWAESPPRFPKDTEGYYDEVLAPNSTPEAAAIHLAFLAALRKTLPKKAGEVHLPDDSHGQFTRYGSTSP